MPTEKLAARLDTVLERFKGRWKPEAINLLAARLMEFAKTLRDT